MSSFHGFQLDDNAIYFDEETDGGRFTVTSIRRDGTARTALATAWGGETIKVATGGSIPLVHALSSGVPDAEILLLGATDGFSNIHAPNERVLVKELRNTVLAQALFFHEYADRWNSTSKR